jgi:hypothetical protein
MNRVRWKSGSLTSVHLESSSSKSVHQGSGSLKSVHWKPCSERCPFTKSLILRLAGAGAFCRACHHQLALLDRYKSLKICESESHFFFPLSAHLCRIHVNLVRAHTSYYFCTLPSWPDSLESYKTVLRNVWVNTEFRMSQLDSQVPAHELPTSEGAFC